jgi:hypothetical protein
MKFHPAHLSVFLGSPFVPIGVHRWLAFRFDFVAAPTLKYWQLAIGIWQCVEVAA